MTIVRVHLWLCNKVYACHGYNLHLAGEILADIHTRKGVPFWWLLRATCDMILMSSLLIIYPWPVQTHVQDITSIPTKMYVAALMTSLSAIAEALGSMNIILYFWRSACQSNKNVLKLTSMRMAALLSKGKQFAQLGCNELQRNLVASGWTSWTGVSLHCGLGHTSVIHATAAVWSRWC